MCGILIHIKKEGFSKKDLNTALESLSIINHRGPDGDGLILINSNNGDFRYINSGNVPSHIHCSNLNDQELGGYNILMGHKRLSIFDLSANGFQPMICKKTGNIIVYNGEIYNWKDIRKELILKGYTFSSETDTEVILAAYDYWGEECFKRFNGMWALAIFDKVSGNIILSRDRFAVKPLFYSEINNEVLFVSEIKQFLVYRNHIRGYNTKLINYFLNEGLINFNEETFFSGIYRFPSSEISLLLTRELKLSFKKYYTLNTDQIKLSEEDAIQKFRYLLNDAVELRLAADVPVGVAVSGGLDSSSIFAIAYNQLKGQGKERFLNTFSVIAKKEEGDESQYIEALLKDYNCKKNFVSIIDDFSIDDLKQHLYMHDFPTVSASFYADYCLSRLIKRCNTTVVLNGQGADEVFAGYHHHFYKYVVSLFKQFKFKLYKEQVNAFNEIKGFDESKVKSAVRSELIIHLKSLFGKHITDDYGCARRWIESKSLNEQMKIDFLEATIPNYLASNDRNTMTFSLESRHPFMDYRLVEFGFSLPDHLKIDKGFQKVLIRKAMHELPDSIRWRKDKMGFTTPEKKLMKKISEENLINKSLVENIGIKFKEDFKYYSLAIWLEKYK